MMKRSVPALLIKELAYEICIIYGGPHGISRPCGMRQVTLSGTRTLNAGLRHREAPRILEFNVFDSFLKNWNISVHF